MFIFDEPTTGLHFHDISKLLAAFNALIQRGHTIVVVEHNMDIIKCADWIVDLGPEAGTARRTGRVRRHAARTGKVHRKPYGQIFAHARKNNEE